MIVKTSTIRRFAHWVSHAPGLRDLTPLWNLLRDPYYWLLARGGSRESFELTVGGSLMRLHPLFQVSTWDVYEPESFRVFSEAIGPGDVVFDIGAHVGFYSILAARRSAPNGR